MASPPTRTILPLELYRTILCQLGSRSDLCVTARVTRYLQIESEMLLYRFPGHFDRYPLV
jgi:hypothetical protein